MKIDQGKAVPFASGLDDPKGLVTFQGHESEPWFLKGKTTVSACSSVSTTTFFTPTRPMLVAVRA